MQFFANIGRFTAGISCAAGAALHGLRTVPPTFVYWNKLRGFHKQLKQQNSYNSDYYKAIAVNCWYSVVLKCLLVLAVAAAKTVNGYYATVSTTAPATVAGTGLHSKKCASP